MNSQGRLLLQGNKNDRTIIGKQYSGRENKSPHKISIQQQQDWQATEQQMHAWPFNATSMRQT